MKISNVIKNKNVFWKPKVSNFEIVMSLKLSNLPTTHAYKYLFITNYQKLYDFVNVNIVDTFKKIYRSGSAPQKFL